jgi:aspartyl/asparaginyl beta-hydroxylase (cupin superfamily)
MSEAERRLRVLEEARAEFGPEALRRLEGPVLALAGRCPCATSNDPYQRPNGLFIPELKAAPWHDPAWIPEAAALESHFTTFREELELLLARRGGFQPYDEGDEGFTPYNITGKWNVFYFLLGCKEVPAARDLCPRTAGVLRSLPNVAQSAMFSALTAGTHLWPHCGATNALISLSMGLMVPPGCTMRVGREERTWQGGKCLVFDDSFEHEVWNRGTGTRFILLLDVWHPELTPVERQVVPRLLWAPGEAEAQIARHTSALHGQTWWQ